MGANGITPNCNGHTVRGSGPGSTGIGIKVPADMSGVTIKNCRVIGFDNGFNIVGSNNKLQGNLASNNELFGFATIDTNNVELLGNVARDNGNSGFAFDDAFDDKIQGNTATHNGGAGFSIYDMSIGNNLKGNKAADNAGSGFFLSGSVNNTLRVNEAIHNGDNGFLLFDGSDKNNLQGNKAVNNGDNGFFVNELLQQQAAGKYSCKQSIRWLPSFCGFYKQFSGWEQG
jgi:parallel beta-helix repeat protein